MADYISAYSGEEVDEAVGKALNPDTEVTEDSTNLIESGAVYNETQKLTALTGSGTPSVSLGTNGQFYTDISATPPMLYQKLNNAWVVVAGNVWDGGFVDVN